MIERPSSLLALRESIINTPGTRRVMLGLLATLTLAGCVRESSEPEIPGDNGEDGDEESSADVFGPPVLGPVVWATSITAESNEPEVVVAQVPVEADAIYAVFPVERLADGTELRASWTFNGDPLEGLDAEITVPRDQIGGWLEFHLERGSSDPWPDGEYGISLTTDGILVATGRVDVVRSDIEA